MQRLEQIVRHLGAIDLEINPQAILWGTDHIKKSPIGRKIKILLRNLIIRIAAMENKILKYYFLNYLHIINIIIIIITTIS